MPIEPLPAATRRLLHVEIDGRSVSVPEGTTVLRAAEARRRLRPVACARTRSCRLSAAAGCAWWRSPACAATRWPAARSPQEGMQVTTDTRDPARDAPGDPPAHPLASTPRAA